MPNGRVRVSPGVSGSHKAGTLFYTGFLELQW